MLICNCITHQIVGLKFVLISLLFFHVFAQAQNSSIANDSLTKSIPKYYFIEKVVIEGNKRTKEKIIRRELKYKENDSIPSLKLDSILLWERNKIFNTNLFVTVDVKLIRNDSNQNATLHVHVREQWYTVPQLVFDVPNQSITYFINELKGDLSKVNFGAKLFQRNCFGRNQTLRLTVQAGFTRNIDVSYEIPYINKKQTLGIIMYTSVSNSRDLQFATIENKWKSLDLTPYGDFRYLKNRINRESFRVGAGINYRPGFFTNHFFEMAYYHNTLTNDTIAKINPEFFLNGQTKQRYFYLHYAINDDHRDVRQFALKGYVSRVDIEQLGITPFETQNITRLTATHARYYPLTKRFSYAGRVKMKVSFPDLQPFVDFRALGGGQDLVRGYDIYQIDGQHYFLWRNSLRFKVFSKLFNLGKLVFVRQFRYVPIDIYFSLFSDAGYVVNQSDISTMYFRNDKFSNKPLGSIGIGLNIVTFYNSVFRLEWSLNGANYYNVSFNIFADI